MRIAPLTVDNIEYAMKHIWDRHRKEAETMGVTMRGLSEVFSRLINKPFTAAFYNDEDVCCGLVALDIVNLVNNHPRYRSYFVATERGWHQIWFEITHFFTQITNDLVKKGATIEALTIYGYGKGFDWLTAMGFSCKGQTGDIFKFVKEAR
jgi:hypothetical protein